MKIKVGDNVIVTRGKDKGRTGKVSEVNPKAGTVLVEGINKVTKHRKPNTSSQPAGKYEETRPIAVSKVGLVHPSKKGRASRVGFKVTNKGKARIYKANGKEI